MAMELQVDGSIAGLPTCMGQRCGICYKGHVKMSVLQQPRPPGPKILSRQRDVFVMRRCRLALHPFNHGPSLVESTFASQAVESNRYWLGSRVAVGSTS